MFVPLRKLLHGYKTATTTTTATATTFLFLLYLLAQWIWQHWKLCFIMKTWDGSDIRWKSAGWKGSYSTVLHKQNLQSASLKLNPSWRTMGQSRNVIYIRTEDVKSVERHETFGICCKKFQTMPFIPYSDVRSSTAHWGSYCINDLSVQVIQWELMGKNSCQVALLPLNILETRVLTMLNGYWVYGYHLWMQWS